MEKQTLSSLKKMDSVLYIYQYGSSIYKISNINSDIDYIVITKEDFNNIEMDDSEGDFSFYTISQWWEMIKSQCIECFECLNLDKKFIHKNYVSFQIFVDKIALRKEISSTCSNSFVKCKKKFLQNDFYIGKKSLWHSLRIGLFGIQISKYGKIVDYTIANNYYADIVLNDCEDWEYYKQKYKPISNAIMTEFRSTMEKEWNEHLSKITNV